MKTEFARFLKRARGDRTLRDLAKAGDLSHQALNNYETGARFPAEELLPKIAQCYGQSEEVVRSVYRASLPQAVSDRLAEEPFLEVLESARERDNLVVITQRSIIDERPDLASKVVGLVARGINFTYVAYLPEDDDYRRHARLWRGNHRPTADVFWHKLRRLQRHGTSPRGEMNYLLVGCPDEYDFCFLRWSGATIYLCRTPESEVDHLDGWSEQRQPDRKRWWTPYDEPFLEELHDWLVDYCGLQLPGAQFDERRAVNATERHVRLCPLRAMAEGESG